VNRPLAPAADAIVQVGWGRRALRHFEFGNEIGKQHHAGEIEYLTQPGLHLRRVISADFCLQREFIR
jgi:hypothetical protein